MHWTVYFVAVLVILSVVLGIIGIKSPCRKNNSISDKLVDLIFGDFDP